jgi:RNA polymerase sigma-70 factor (ECF subfamily)
VSAQPDPVNRTLEGFRAFLECLASIHTDPRLRLDPRLRRRFGLSDIVQKTLLEAWLILDRIEALDAQGRQRWLRRMLIHNLLERIEKEKAAMRDYRLEQPLEEALEQSSCRLKDYLAADESLPPDRLLEQERALRLAEALAQLPERQREAIILQKWHGWKLAQIAEYLGCTPGAVAGLHAHGLARLRQLVPADLLEEP